jgi:hypothetical protein
MASWGRWGQALVSLPLSAAGRGVSTLNREAFGKNERAPEWSRTEARPLCLANTWHPPGRLLLTRCHAMNPTGVYQPEAETYFWRPNRFESLWPARSLTLVHGSRLAGVKDERASGSSSRKPALAQRGYEGCLAPARPSGVSSRFHAPDSSRLSRRGWGKGLPGRSRLAQRKVAAP